MYEEIIKKLTEMIEKAADVSKTFSGNAWSLLVEAQKATALAGILSSIIGIIFAISLYSVAYRLLVAAKKEYEANNNAERAGVFWRGIFAVIAIVCGACDLKAVWDTLPMAIAQYRHPAAFVALEAVERVAPKK